jgi:hypothetical protein
MSETFVRADEGQALVVVGVAIAVIVGALVLSADWGYGLSMRRAAQNQADAAALAAGRLLATSYSGSGPVFAVTQEDVWNAACEARRANTAGVGANRTMEISFFDGARSPYLPTFSSSDETCTLNGPTEVPPGTTFVSVRSETSYLSLFAVVTRQTIVAAASALARLTAGTSARQLRLPAAGAFPVGSPGVGLSGESTAPNVAIWPIVMRYRGVDWSAGALRTFTLVGPTATSTFVSLSHFSPHEASSPAFRQVHQLVTQSDVTASSHVHHSDPTGIPPSAPNMGPAACGATWETTGSADLTTTALCDVPNWFYYGYRGSLGIGTDWATTGTWHDFESYSSGVEAPSPLTPSSRSSCNIRTDFPYFSAPSCSGTGASTLGDWVETVRGVDPTVVASEIRMFVERYGRDVRRGGVPEKAVVVNLFLWDCGETYAVDSPDVRDNWELVGSSGDCSTATGGAFDRVHLFTAAPITIRESDIHDAGPSSYVNATWGGIFGDPGICATEPTPPDCGLNPLINSAFLVPDE